MTDFKVTFRGDLGNLSQFDAAIKNSALSSARALQQANQNIATSVSKISDSFDVKKQRSIADAVNNTFRQSGDIVRKYVSSYTTEMDKTRRYKIKPIFEESYHSSFNRAIGNLQAYELALKKVARSEAQLLAARQRFAGIQAFGQNLEKGLTTRRDIAKAALIKNPDIITKATALQIAQDEYNRAMANLAATKPGTKGISQVRLTAKNATNDLNYAKAQLSAARKPLEDEINRINRVLDKLGAREATAAGRLASTESRIFARKGYRDLNAAVNATPPIQSDLGRVLLESRDLQKNLLRGGLGLGTKYGTPEFQRALAQQEAQVTSYTRNLRTNVRTVQGEFKDAAGLMNKFTVDLDNQGKVVGRWGGQLGGAGSILRQTVRDFQKVIEWTVATTVVFGTLATVVGQLQSINDLNTALARFSITAQTSAQETTSLFQQLSQVAFDTATPLKELVTVADDIALATRVVGQSTEDWHQRILELTTAVGIFTNLTGTETVAAADQLSSTFKQLGVEPDALIGILNKVTAVAGGQANAIADIVKSLSSVAEAGRAAGLSIDEQIASVQVLAQVTGKTSAEIATAFKNLFGSLSSVGSEKILKEFGINVRDATGGVLGFLDIYREIADALEKGIIPQSRLTDVLRGIAGGPRRVPDAAALLSNVGRIDEVIGRSANATNEALVANAKILDTNQAKIIQFQNAIDTAVFQKFGEAVKNLTNILTDIGIAFAGIFNKIPTDIATTGIQIGILITTMFGLGKVLGYIARSVGLTNLSLNNMATSFKAVSAAAASASAATLAADARLAKSGLILPTGVQPGTVFTGAAKGSRFAGLTNLLKNNKRNVGAIAGIGVAGGAGVLGGLDEQTIGTILQAGGALALLSGALAPIGIAAIVAGTAIQAFGDNSAKAVQNTADLSSEIFTLTENLKATQQEADEFAKRQKEAASQISSLQAKSKLTADEQLRLSGATSEYVESTLALAAANQTVSGTFDEILEKLKETGGVYEKFYGTLTGLTPDSPGIKKISQGLLEEILKNTPGASVYAGPRVPFTGIATPSRGGSTIARAAPIPGPGGGTPAQTIDLTELINNPRLLPKLFEVLGPSTSRPGERLFEVPINDESLRYLQSALVQLQKEFQAGTGELTKEQIDQLTAAILELSKSTSSFAQNTAALAQSRAGTARNQALGIFNGQQVVNATNAQNLIEGLLSAQRTAPSSLTDFRGYTQPVVGQSTQLIEVLGQKAEKGIAATSQEIINAISYMLQLQKATEGAGSVYDQLGRIGQQALNEGIYLEAQRAGFSVEELSGLARILSLDLEKLNELTEDFTANFENARAAARAAFADRALKLTIAENSGEYEKNAAGLRALQEQNVAAQNSTLGLIDTMETLSGTAFVELNNALSQVIGLQGEYISTTMAATIPPEELAQRQADLAGKLIEAAIAAGVNAEGIRKIKDEIPGLIALIAAIPDYKQVIIEMVTVRRDFAGTLGASGTYRIDNATAQQLIAKGKAAGQTAQTDIKKIIDQINSIISGGTGSSFGQLPKTTTKATRAAAYNKPGLLDIPEEIINASNTSQLLQQAIRNARNLQSKIPGETKANKNEIVELLNGTKRILETRGIGEEYLRRAMDELTGEIKRQNDLLSKADTIRRIRVGTGDFSALANVPINSQSGVSVGGPQGPISISLDVNGTVLTPAQFMQFSDMIAASIKRQLSA